MSWQLLDESSRRARVIWTIPDRLRVNPRNSHSFSTAAVDPDALIDYIDNVVASFEHDQASSQLIAQFPPNGRIPTADNSVALKENPNSDQKIEETDVVYAETVSVKSEKLLDNEGADVNEQNNDDKFGKSNDNEQYNAKEADEAYRAACLALSEGHAELALSLLHIASVKCPPYKHNAIRKVKQLSSAAVQLLEKKSAALTLIPVEKKF